jgi:hypothetical protein
MEWLQGEVFNHVQFTYDEVENRFQWLLFPNTQAFRPAFDYTGP